MPPVGYGAFLRDLKEGIRQARVRCALALLAIGQRILVHQKRQGRASWSKDQILENYPGTVDDDIRACIAHGSEMPLGVLT